MTIYKKYRAGWLRPLLLIVSLPCTLVLLSSCSSLSTTEYPSSLTKPEPLALPITKNEKPRFLVVVRYYQGALPDSYKAARTRYLSTGPTRAITDTRGLQGAFNSFFVKSVYYGLEVAGCIASSIPDIDVLVEPVTIAQKPDGEFFEISPDLPIPASLVVHAAPHIDPDTQRGDWFTTFGHQLVPEFSIAVGTAVAPNTAGAVAVPELAQALLDFRPEWSEWDARSGAAVTQVDLLNAGDEFDYAFRFPAGWTYGAIEPTGMWRKRASRARPWVNGSYLAIPPRILRGRNAKSPAVCDIPVKIIRDVRSQLFASNFENKRLEQYGRGWQTLFAEAEDANPEAGSIDPVLRGDYLESFYKAEVDFLLAMQADAVNYLMDGDWGESVRAFLDVEDIARSQSEGTFWKGMGTALAVGVINSSAGQPVDPMLAGNNLDMFEENAKLRAASANLATLKSKISAASYVVNAGAGLQTIQATSQLELREKMLRLYLQSN